MMSLKLYFFFSLVALLLSDTTSYSQSSADCSCDLIISKSGSYTNKKEGVQPGQTVCIQAGSYTGLYFTNFIGSAEKPIRFINCGGQVIISSDKTPTGIQFYGCQYFALSGTGAANYLYGIRIDKTSAGAQAVSVAAKSSDCEIDHIEVAGASFAGIMVKTDPTCDSTTWRGNLIVRNVKIHHNYIHDTNSEGIYVGSTSWNEGYKLQCGGLIKTILPHNIYGLEIHHNITERTGTEGIQYAASPDADVHHNIVRNSGLTPFATFQNNGMQIGGGVSGRFYNNQIINAPAAGIVIIGNLGNTKVYNNLVINSGTNGIFCDDRPGSLPNTDMLFANNTIINSGEEAIKLYNEINNNVIANNLIAKVGPGRRYMNFSQGAKAKEMANFMTLSIDSVGFVDPNEQNYRLQSTSNLIDSGTEQGIDFLTIDLDDKYRPIGRSVDIGAYEFRPINSHVLNLYPSPCDDQISIWSDELIKQVAVYTIDGKEVIHINPNAVENVNLSVNSLAAGMYILRAETTKGALSKRFLKR